MPLPKMIDETVLEVGPGWYICHQMDCVSTAAYNHAKAIFAKFPAADLYKARLEIGTPDTPGTIKITQVDGRHIVHMFGQYAWGKPTPSESQEMREEWFQSCLCALALGLRERLNNDHPGEKFKVAFTWNIGCGLEQGIWPNYIGFIVKFMKDVEDIAEVFICGDRWDFYEYIIDGPDGRRLIDAVKPPHLNGK